MKTFEDQSQIVRSLRRVHWLGREVYAVPGLIPVISKNVRPITEPYRRERVCRRKRRVLTRSKPFPIERRAIG